MPLSLISIQLLLPSFVLVLFRVGGITLTAPMFSSQTIPTRLRVGLAFVIALMVFPIVGPLTPDETRRLHLIHDAHHLSFLIPTSPEPDHG